LNSLPNLQLLGHTALIYHGIIKFLKIPNIKGDHS
jgi:hypothetical protein